MPLRSAGRTGRSGTGKLMDVPTIHRVSLPGHSRDCGQWPCFRCAVARAEGVTPAPPSVKTKRAAAMNRTVEPRVPMNSAGPMAPGHVAGDPQVLRLVARYLEILEDTSAPGTPELQDLAAAHVQDLLALAHRQACEPAEIAGGNCRRAVRLQAILAEIAVGFADPDLSLVDVAKKLAISPRYVQVVLHDTGRSFTERITELRLNKARALLARDDTP